jgi:hypothetical protein
MWTTEPPAEPGWYWIRMRGHNGGSPARFELNFGHWVCHRFGDIHSARPWSEYERSHERSVERIQAPAEAGPRSGP